MADVTADYLPKIGDLSGFIVCAKSPSCGLERVRLYDENGNRGRKEGVGLFTAALLETFPWLPVEVQGLAWRDETSWLWATADSWGCCPCSDVPSFPGLVSRVNAGEFRLCTSASLDGQNFDAWSAIHRLQPPLPARGDSFTVALGLALGAGQP